MPNNRHDQNRYTYYAISLLRGPYRYGKRNSLCGEAAQDRMREHKSEEPRNAVISIPWLLFYLASIRGFKPPTYRLGGKFGVSTPVSRSILTHSHVHNHQSEDWNRLLILCIVGIAKGLLCHFCGLAGN